MRHRVLALALALALAVALGAAAVHAQQGSDWEADFDENKKEWKEIEAKIPSYPKDGNLVAFDAGPATPHRFFIDIPSISIGPDGVVRYSLVVKTAGGATNVTYEGIRCETREQKYYAVGQRDGNWTRARNPQWRRIEPKEVNRQHNVLYKDFLCNGGTNGGIPAPSVRQIVQELKYGKPAGMVD
jgi:hypothetical protein